MKLCKEGKYTKFTNSLMSNGKSSILAFVSDNGNDNYFRILEIIRKTQRMNGHQCCSYREQFEKFETILHIFYNIYGEIIDYEYIRFDFENEKVTIGDKTLKVKRDKNREYTFKLQKTQIKAIDGIEGFYRFIVESMHVDDALNSSVNNMLKKIAENK